MTAVVRLARVVGAALALVLLTVGVPLVLIRTAGWPLPRDVPSADRIVTALRQGEVPGEVVIKAIALVVWVAWAQLVWAVVWELAVNVPRTARGQRPCPAPLVVAPLSSGVGRLVAAVLASGMLSASTPLVAVGPVHLAASSLAAVTTVGLDDLDASPGPVPQRGADVAPAAPAAPAGLRVWHPTADDTLWAIAERALGDGSRVSEILELNPRLSPRALPLGRGLVLPADAEVPADRSADPARRRLGAAERSPDGDVEGGGGGASVVVEAPGYVAAETITVSLGDDLWTLSEERLAEGGVDDPGVTLDYLDAVVDRNEDVVEDPDLIYPGERFDFPAIGVPPVDRRPPRVAPVPAAPARPSPTIEPEQVDDAPVPTVVEVPAPPSPVADPPSTTTPEPVVEEETPRTSVAGSPATHPPTAASTSTTFGPAVPDDPAAPTESRAPSPAPSPLGLGQAALLSAGVLALLAARRRARLRAARPRARVPSPTEEAMATERLLRSVDAGERLLRIDIAVRAAALSLVEGSAQIAVVLSSADGEIELVLTGAGHLPPPWSGDGHRWVLPGATPIELLAEAARAVGIPCVALVPIGVAGDGRDVLVDLEALGVLAVDADTRSADMVINGIASSLTSSLFAESANVIAVDVDEVALLGHPRASFQPTVDSALELAVTLVGTTTAAKHSTFALRARHTSGEAWEPALVVVGAATAATIGDEATPIAQRRVRGLALVAGAPVPEAQWTIRAFAGGWTLEPLGLAMSPVGLRPDEVHALAATLVGADQPLVDDDLAASAEGAGMVDRRALGDPIAAAAGLGELGDPVWADSDEAADAFDAASVVLTIDGRDVAGDRVAAASPAARSADEYVEPAWSVLVRLLGPVAVAGRTGTTASFDRSKALELVAWLATHRDHPTRGGARAALWELDVRDATFANVVSDARRAMARLVEPPPGEEWLGRTLTDVLPLHRGVIADADLVRARLDHARLQPPEMAIDTLRPAVELIRDLPFAGTGYLWPDAEGTTSNLVLLATSAATELAGHHLSMGDVEGVFWATGQGLRVLPGHEELIALRMRAHAQVGDLAGVRQEWESYERVVSADPWSDGEPAAKLAVLRRDLLS